MHIGWTHHNTNCKTSPHTQRHTARLDPIQHQLLNNKATHTAAHTSARPDTAPPGKIATHTAEHSHTQAEPNTAPTAKHSDTNSSTHRLDPTQQYALGMNAGTQAPPPTTTSTQALTQALTAPTVGQRQVHGQGVLV
jgi:hypothetical protein